MSEYTVLFALLMALGTSQRPHTSPELGYSMTVPAGFLSEGEDPLNRRAVACFVTYSATTPVPWVRLCVERRGGALPKSAQKMTFAWRGQDVRGASFDSEWNGENVTVFAALVPLRKEPVWLVAMARRTDGAYAQAALVSTLATLQGESATLSPAERAERAGSQVGFVGSILIAIGAGMWIMKRRQEQQPG